MKLFEIIILIFAAVAGIAILLAVTGKKAVSGLAKGTENLLGSAATPGIVTSGVAAVKNAVVNTQTSEVGYSASVAPGTYVTAGTLRNPLAFAVVGGVDNRPEKGALFGSQSGGYGGITASKEGAGASGYRSSDSTGTWTSAGYTTRY